jgi:hypothetical protein
VQVDPLLGQRLAQVRLQCDALEQLRVSVRVEPGEPVAAGVLRPVQGHVGVAEHRVQRPPGRGGQADAGGDGERPPTEVDGLADRLQQAPGDRLGAGGVVPEQDDGELVAAQARHEVVGPQRPRQPPGGLHQQRVTGGVPQAVVDQLEAVEVEEQHRRPAVPTAPAAGAGEQLDAVEQPGQRVVGRLVRELRAHGLGVPVGGALGVEQALALLLLLVARRDVLEVDDDALGRRLGVHLGPHVERLGVVGLEADRDPLAHHRRVRALEPAAACVGEDLEQVPTEQGPPVGPQQDLGPRVDVGEAELPVQGQEPVADGLEHLGDARPGLVAVGHVDHDADQLHGGPVLVVDDVRRAAQHVADAAVVQDQAVGVLGLLELGERGEHPLLVVGVDPAQPRLEGTLAGAVGSEHGCQDVVPEQLLGEGVPLVQADATALGCCRDAAAHRGCIDTGHCTTVERRALRVDPSGRT